MEVVNYCNKCILQEGYGIVLSRKNGLCPSYLGDYGSDIFKKVDHLREKYICSTEAELEYLLKVILNMHYKAKELGFKIANNQSETPKQADSAIYTDQACDFKF